ncbi:hypothetical protein LWI28_013022 [Acer negundo]|uniref:Uncharacterized protein n=1 Tax=Acer negundo TaxID=4023 RepID=A0AAD5I6V7_ACENE|nr:hypothetical protein LWI28_013022 [Acer negundo]
MKTLNSLTQINERGELPRNQRRLAVDDRVEWKRVEIVTRIRQRCRTRLRFCEEGVSLSSWFLIFRAL